MQPKLVRQCSAYFPVLHACNQLLMLVFPNDECSSMHSNLSPRRAQHSAPPHGLSLFPRRAAARSPASDAAAGGPRRRPGCRSAAGTRSAPQQPCSSATANMSNLRAAAPAPGSAGTTPQRAHGPRGSPRRPGAACTGPRLQANSPRGRCTAGYAAPISPTEPSKQHVGALNLCTFGAVGRCSVSPAPLACWPRRTRQQLDRPP
jgi:hypothetical protein